jgi:dTDP-4-amino-4,6-dideoxygalactose transaminase
MTELEAAVSIGQFKHLDEWNAYRRDLAQYLTKKLSCFDLLETPYIPAHVEHVYFVYPIKLNTEKIPVARTALVKALNAEGVPCGGGYVRPIYYEPMYQKQIALGTSGAPFKAPYYSGKLNYQKGICPVCERMHEKELVVTAVCRYPNTKQDVDDVVNAFDKVFSNLKELREGNNNPNA